MTNCEKTTALWPLLTTSASFSTRRLSLPLSVTGALSHGRRSGSQQACRRRVSSARKPNDFSRMAAPTSSPRRTRPSLQMRAYSERCRSVSGQSRSISTLGGSSWATSSFVRRRMNGASCCRRRVRVLARSAPSTASKACRVPSSPGSR